MFLSNNPKVYVRHCGGNEWGGLIAKKGVFVSICHEVESTKFYIYQIGTVNIKQGSLFRYPTITWPIAVFVISE